MKKLFSSKWTLAIIAAVLLAAGAAVAANFNILVVISPATTTAAAQIKAASLTSGSGLQIITSANTVMTSGGKAIRVNDGNADVFAVGYNGHIQVLPTNGTATTATNTGGSSITCVSGNNAGSCSDTRGEVRVTTAANTNPIVVTFGVAYLAAPICTVQPANLNADVDFASATIAPVTTTSTTALTITPSANWAANAKILRYLCIE